MVEVAPAAVAATLVTATSFLVALTFVEFPHTPTLEAFTLIVDTEVLAVPAWALLSKPILVSAVDATIT